ncbi:MAG TPA: TetR/AcrR family transcriptional regulator [Acetobacteraceae bacterium]|nr:TetR/AcrR family transcriptional regulator [Acetobacteraceae bacterium]
MVSQAERRANTRKAILTAAEDLFGQHGFAATTVDGIAAAAGVAKGAVYHHFATKENVFEAVFEATSEALVQRVVAASTQAKDALDGMVVGSRAYFTACAEARTGRIILQDGPAVLGWERWREIDARHFGRMIPMALDAAMAQGLIANQPVPPLARLLLGAVTEAAVASAGAADPARTGLDHVRALETVLTGLRMRRAPARGAKPGGPVDRDR